MVYSHTRQSPLTLVPGVVARSPTSVWLPFPSSFHVVRDLLYSGAFIKPAKEYTRCGSRWEILDSRMMVIVPPVVAPGTSGAGPSDSFGSAAMTPVCVV